MKVFQRWREITLIALLLVAILLIHPFSKPGVVVTYVEGPATGIFRVGDIITQIDNDIINTLDEFNDNLQNLEENVTVKVYGDRESFPYNYIPLTNLFLTSDKDNPLGIYAEENKFTKMQFNSQLEPSNRFIIKTDDPSNTIKVLKKRFKITNVNDYLFKKEADKVLLYSTTSGTEILPIIESSGSFEAKIGDKTFFTEEDVESYCRSGVNCLLQLYPLQKIEENQTSIVWKYGFESKITKEASSRFEGITKGLSIEECKLDKCQLNETIDYYLDDQKVGFEYIYAEDKGHNLSRPFIGGELELKDEATNMLRLTQAALIQKIDAKVESVEKVDKLMNINFLNITIIAISIIIALSGVVSFILFKDILTTLVGAGITAAEIAIIFGLLTGLNYVLSPIAMGTIIFVSLISGLYQNYALYKVKKEGLILKKVSDINKNLNRILWGLLAITILLIVTFSAIGVPLFLFTVIALFVSKTIHINQIKSKR